MTEIPQMAPKHMVLKAVSYFELSIEVILLALENFFLSESTNTLKPHEDHWLFENMCM